MVYGDLKALPRGNAFDKSLHDNALEMASNPQYGNIWVELHHRAVEKGGTGGRLPPPPPFPGAKAFFHVKSENIKFA